MQCVCILFTANKLPLHKEEDLRLNAEGDSEPRTYSGRLEIYHDGQWGTVCDDKFSDLTANTTCQQLGFLAALYSGNADTIGYVVRCVVHVHLGCVLCVGCTVSTVE